MRRVPRGDVYREAQCAARLPLPAMRRFAALLRLRLLPDPPPVSFPPVSGLLFSPDWYYAEEIGDYGANLVAGKGLFLNQAGHYLLDKKSRAATG